MNLSVFARALRLPFLSASVLPFVAGSLFARGHWNPAGFLLGFIAVSATHLSANLINDYADSKSGADWEDRNYYAFFGGSKLIQAGVLKEGFYLKTAVFFAVLACACVSGLVFLSGSIVPLVYFAGIIFLAWSYSQKPIAFSYRAAGEPVIFLLFGPVPVMGGYFIQSGIFPDLGSFLLSLPFGFFTAAILFVNEVPDFSGDASAGKRTWAGFTGPRRAYLLYALLAGLGFASVVLLAAAGYISPWGLVSLILLIPAAKAAVIIKEHSAEKAVLLGSSKLTIALQALMSLFIIGGILL